MTRRSRAVFVSSRIDAAARAELGERARLLYEEEFDWSVVADRLLAQLLPESPAPYAHEDADLEHHFAGV